MSALVQMPPASKVLLLVGPQGSGRGLLAQELAKQFRRVRYANGESLGGDFGFGRALRTCPDLLIVEGLPPNHRTLCLLVSAPRVTCDVLGFGQVDYPRPAVICLAEPTSLPEEIHRDRRFHIHHVGVTA